MERFGVAELAVGGGWIGLSPMPGRAGDYAGDLAAVLSWAPGMVLTMATAAELALGAAALPADLAAAGIAWRHLPVADFAAESVALREGWAGVSGEARGMLGAGGRVLVHCLGGCGRSGMAALRLMAECGEAPEAALARLRRARPCAIETEDQRRWAAGG
ncbi:protein phosphatase [Albidovulum sp.]|jgi:protein-tyrosine phosphatase|uniref:protein-tyrosine phosphatase family protein n=1 Tax=Albidovulum sp. TaxID=1872424 RepID=UPI003043B95F